jgi:hypothetical protein
MLVVKNGLTSMTLYIEVLGLYSSIAVQIGMITCLDVFVLFGCLTKLKGGNEHISMNTTT